MSDWHEKEEVKKGDFAEEIVDKFLEDKGYTVYKPVTEGPHCFDRLLMKGKKKMAVCDIKAKARRTYYPDTGIDKKHYEEYLNIGMQYGLQIYLFFVDEHEKQIYGNNLEQLSKSRVVGKFEYPLEQKGIIYFPLEAMIIAGKLTDAQCEYLKKYSTRSYEYKP